jgi:hypothetical protein
MIDPARHGFLNFGVLQFVFVRKSLDSAPNRLVTATAIDL